MRKKNTAAVHGEVFVLPPVLPTLPHISGQKTAFVADKNFNSPSDCDENKMQRPSALLTEISGNFPPENGLRPHK